MMASKGSTSSGSKGHSTLNSVSVSASDWFRTISRLTKRIAEGVFDDYGGKTVQDTTQLTESLETPRDWIEYVLNDFGWQPFDPFKTKTVGFPVALPPARGEDAYALTEFTSGVAYMHDVARGRYVVAARDLAPGEHILKEKCFASTVNHTLLKDVCATCKKYKTPDEFFLVCENCKSTAWCSEACKQVAMRDYHEWECPFTRQLQASFRHFTMALRMVLSNWQALLHRFVCGESRLVDTHAEELVPNSTEYDLIGNFENLSKSQCLEFALVSKVFLYVLRAGGFARRLREATVAVKNGLVQQLTNHTQLDGLARLLKLIVNYQMQIADLKFERKIETYVGVVMMEHIMRIKSNCFELNAQLVGKKSGDPPIYTHVGVSPIGTVLFLRASQINHSCKPNCGYYFTGDTQNIKTIDHIREGEEIFITYERVGKAMPDREDRIPHLTISFGFECMCEFCQGPPEKDLISRCQDAEASDQLRHSIDFILQTADQAMQEMRLSDAEGHLFKAKGMAKAFDLNKLEMDIDDTIDYCLGLGGNVLLSANF